MTALRSLLVARGLMSTADVAALEGFPAYRGASLAERAYRSGLVSDAALAALFAELGATEGTAELAASPPTAAALGVLSRTMAERHRAIPLRLERARLVVGFLDPSDTNAIEKVAFFTGLAVEPRHIRPRVLFRALAQAYGIPVLLPDGAFQEARPAPRPETASPAPVAAPVPLPPTPERAEPARTGPTPAADLARSPLAREVVRATGFAEDDVDMPSGSFLLPTVRDMRPASSPALAFPGSGALDALRRSLPPASVTEARDSLPPQVLGLLVPPFRAAALFLVRGDVAVGWDGRVVKGSGDALGQIAQRAQVRDLLLPLTGTSVFEHALRWRRVAVGNPSDPTTIERMLQRHLGTRAASSFAVLPILVGTQATALLYVDRAEGMIDDALIDGARRVGNALADGLAPFVAQGTLFPDVPLHRLRPLPGHGPETPGPAAPGPEMPGPEMPGPVKPPA